MKKLIATLAFGILSANAFAMDDCGYGNRYKQIQCELSLSQTFEAGYNETYARQTIQINGSRPGGSQIALGSLRGLMNYSIGADGGYLTVQFSQAVEGVASQIVQKVNFPEVCNGEERGLVVYGKYTENRGGSSIQMDLDISCKNVVSFDKD